MKDLRGFDLGDRLVHRKLKENRIVVFHHDRACASLVSGLLSSLDYACATPVTIAQLRLALKTPCSGVVVDWEAYSQAEIGALLKAADVPLVIALVSNDEAADVAPLESVPVRVLRLDDLSCERLAECFAASAPGLSGDDTQAVGETVAQLAPIASPKLKIIQSMLREVASDITPDATMIFSRTLPSRADDTLTDPRLAKLPAMILQGQSLAALSTCHEIEESLGRKGTTGTQPSNVSELRRCLEQELLEPNIELVAGDLRIYPISNRSVLIGRPAKERNADIAINCRWFSRADKSLSLSSDGTEWYVEDLGSANGSFVGEKRLQRNARHTLPLGQTTVEIGRSFERRSPVILNFNRAAPDVVVVSVSVGAAFDKAGWQTWPSLQEDLGKRWVVFRDEFVLGSDYAHKALGLAVQDNPAAVAFRNGFWIAPFRGSEIHLDNIAFRSAVPLPAETELCVGSLKLRIERKREGEVDATSAPGDNRARIGMSP